MSLFQGLVTQIIAVKQTRALTGSEMLFLQKSYDYLGQAYYGHGEFAQAYDAFSKLAILNPNYRFDENLVSPKIIKFFTDICKQNEEKKPAPDPAKENSDEKKSLLITPNVPAKNPDPAIQEPQKKQETVAPVTPPKADQPAPIPKEEAVNSTGTIYIYRTGDMFQGSPSVYLDQTELARLEKGRYFIAHVEPGSHTIWYRGFGYISPGRGIATLFTGKLYATVRAGKAYYFRLLFDRNTFDSVPETGGKTDLEKLKPSDNKDIRDHQRVTVP